LKPKVRYKLPQKLYYVKAFVSKKQLQIPFLVGVLTAETLSRKL